MDFRRIPRRKRKGCFRFLENALDRAYHNNVQIFRKWYFRFLPSKPEVIVPVLYNIEWINDDFSETIFSTRNLLIQRPLRCGTSVFLCWIPACCRCKCKNFPSRKITVHFKLNLKTDGPDCKMIFNFGKHVERFHSIRGADVYTTSAFASNVSVYTNTICVAKYLLGTPKPLNCIRWMQD